MIFTTREWMYLYHMVNPTITGCKSPIFLCIFQIKEVERECTIHQSQVISSKIWDRQCTKKINRHYSLQHNVSCKFIITMPYENTLNAQGPPKETAHKKAKGMALTISPSWIFLLANSPHPCIPDLPKQARSCSVLCSHFSTTLWN